MTRLRRLQSRRRSAQRGLGLGAPIRWGRKPHTAKTVSLRRQPASCHSSMRCSSIATSPALPENVTLNEERCPACCGCSRTGRALSDGWALAHEFGGGKPHTAKTISLPRRVASCHSSMRCSSIATSLAQPADLRKVENETRDFVRLCVIPAG